MGERWLPVVGFEGLYEVSDLGRVRSVDRWIQRRSKTGTPHPHRLRGRLLTPLARDPRYWSVQLGNGNMRRVHDLVAEAFIGPRPLGQMVLHADDDGHHNAASNLRYGSNRENRADHRRNSAERGRLLRSDGRLLASDVVHIKALLPSTSPRVIARAWGVSRGCIEGIKRGVNWPDINPGMDADIVWNARRELERRAAG